MASCAISLIMSSQATPLVAGSSFRVDAQTSVLAFPVDHGMAHSAKPGVVELFNDALVVASEHPQGIARFDAEASGAKVCCAEPLKQAAIAFAIAFSGNARASLNRFLSSYNVRDIIVIDARLLQPVGHRQPRAPVLQAWVQKLHLRPGARVKFIARNGCIVWLVESDAAASGEHLVWGRCRLA